MAALPVIDEAAVRRLATREVFARGEAYARGGAVGPLTLRGGTLQAQVAGSELTPYEVAIELGAGGVVAASCTCPYAFEGWCKHIVAALLVYLHDPAAVSPRPALAALLATLDREQLLRLVRVVAASSDEARRAVEAEADAIGASLEHIPPAGSGDLPPIVSVMTIDTRLPPINLPAFRTRIERIMDVASMMDDYDGDEQPMPDEAALDAIVAEIGARVVMQPDIAIQLLDALTAPYVAGMTELYESYGVDGIGFDTLGEMWARALLSAELTAPERAAWRRKLAGWRDALAEVYSDARLDIALLAAEQGWNQPQLVAAMRGELPVWAGEEPDEAELWPSAHAVLAAIRLELLDHQGRDEELLALGRATGRYLAVAVKLVQLGRFEEAVALASERLTAAEEYRQIAQLLVGARPSDALALAERGLNADGQRAPLALWLVDAARLAGRAALAARAAETAFFSQPSLVHYLLAAELAGAAWPAHRAVLLTWLRGGDGSAHPDARVAVFLHEQLIDDAIAAVASYPSRELLTQVMDAALATHPAWVRQRALALADQIISAGKADRYDVAIEWLGRAHAAFAQEGGEDGWRGYVAELRATHGRKHKLMGLLDTMLRPPGEPRLGGRLRGRPR